jgi:hypothetical protein
MGDTNEMYLAKRLDHLSKKIVKGDGSINFFIFDPIKMLEGDFATWSV